MGKVGKAQLLRMQADAVDAAEAFVAAKAERPVCGECGRPLPTVGKPKGDEKKLAELRADMSAKRAAWKEARQEFAAAVEEAEVAGG